MTEPSPAGPRHDFSSISGQMVRGTAWMVAMRWAVRLIGLVNTVIIVRLLTPEDFGIMIMAMVVSAFIEVLFEADADVALLRNTAAGRRDYDSAWTLRILMGGLATAAIFLSAPLVAHYYGDERVTFVVQVVAFRALIMGFENPGVVDFRKHFDFRREFTYWVARRLTMFVLGLALVLWMRSYLALALTVPLAAAVAVAMSFVMSPYRPRLDLGRAGALWSFSRWAIVYQVSRFICERGDQFIIGRVATPEGLGHYYVATDTATLPTEEVVLPVVRALIPTYAQIAHDDGEIRRGFRAVLGFMAILCFSFGAGLAAVSEDFVLGILGDQWAPAVPLFFWSALYGAAAGMIQSIRPYMWSRGHEQVLAFVNVGYAAMLTAVVVFVASRYALVDVAMARTAVSAVAAVATLGVVVALTPVSAGDIAAEVWRPLLAAAAMGMAVWQLHVDWPWRLLSLGQDVATGILVFAAVLFALWAKAGRPAGAEAEIVKLARAKLARRRGR